MAFFAAFMTPVAFVIFINTITFLLIMYKLATRPPNAADPDRTSEGLLKIKRAFGILILVGITWMFGFFAVREARLVFQYLFAIFNSLQGFAIFMFYCVIQKKVRECWWALLTCNLGSLKKSKSIYTDSYDRRRLSSASRVQLDAMRARSNTALSQVSLFFFNYELPDTFWIVLFRETSRRLNLSFLIVPSSSPVSNIVSFCSSTFVSVPHSQRSSFIAAVTASMLSSLIHPLLFVLYV